jgi:toxin ParE1/3/4
MKLVFTAAAIADLEAVTDWITKDNPERALSFLRELRSACFSIPEFPESHPVVPRYETQRIRRKVHGNYLIFYCIGVDVIEIIHILHGAQDYEALLFPRL